MLRLRWRTWIKFYLFFTHVLVFIFLFLSLLCHYSKVMICTYVCYMSFNKYSILKGRYGDDTWSSQCQHFFHKTMVARLDTAAGGTALSRSKDASHTELFCVVKIADSDTKDQKSIGRSRLHGSIYGDGIRQRRLVPPQLSDCCIAILARCPFLQYHAAGKNACEMSYFVSSGT